MYGLDKNIDLRFMLQKEVIQVCIGTGQIAVHFDNKLSIYVEGYVCLRKQDDYFQFSPRNRDGVKFMIDFLGEKITNLVNKGQGDLVVEFSNGFELTLYETPHYESYSIHFEDIEIIV